MGNETNVAALAPGEVLNHAKESSELKLWLELVGEKENGKTFVEVLIKDKTFQDFAEASCHCKAKQEWFENVVKGEDDAKFDSICQKINSKLLGFHIKASGSDDLHNWMVFQMLQTHTLDGILDGNIGVEERACVVSVVMVLMDEMDRKQRNALLKFGDKLAEDEHPKEMKKRQCQPSHWMGNF